MKKVLFLFFASGRHDECHGQKFAVKSNLLYDATATINLGVEMELSKKWTLDLSGNYNGWKFGDDMRWKHWMVQPEARYWLCEKFNGHFLGVHAHYADYNVGGIKFLSKKYGELSLSGQPLRSRLVLWLPMAAEQPLEHGGCDRCRMGASGL